VGGTEESLESMELWGTCGLDRADDDDDASEFDDALVSLDDDTRFGTRCKVLSLTCESDYGKFLAKFRFSR